MDTNDCSPDELIEASTVARWLRISISCVYEQASRGVLPHVRLWKGSRRTLIRFRRSDIEAFLRAQTHGPEGGRR